MWDNQLFPYRHGNSERQLDHYRSGNRGGQIYCYDNGVTDRNGREITGIWRNRNEEIGRTRHHIQYADGEEIVAYEYDDYNSKKEHRRNVRKRREREAWKRIILSKCCCAIV